MLEFFKYHGAGNDFILIDNREDNIHLSKEEVIFLCDRNFGIGGDGLMLLEKVKGYDFAMKYYNPDGTKEMMCGNGGRCIIAFAHLLGIIKDKTEFLAPDGVHKGEIISCEKDKYWIKLSLKDINQIKVYKDGYFVDTGATHFVQFLDDISSIDIISKGREIRYDSRFDFVKGVNANFVEINKDNSLNIRTYERGVEAETLACGTGITASALSFVYKNNLTSNSIEVKAKGGLLRVSFEKTTQGFKNIYLEGEAQMVFRGEIQI
ncbi:MAG: diaminopimelate epimerase [Bacteroidales bacterium]